MVMWLNICLTKLSVMNSTLEVTQGSDNLASACMVDVMKHHENLYNTSIIKILIAM